MSGISIVNLLKPDGLVHLAPMRDQDLDLARRVPGIRCISSCGSAIVAVLVTSDNVDCMACITHADDDYPPGPAGRHFGRMRTTEINAGEIRDAVRRERGVHR